MGKFLNKLIERFASDIIDKKVNDKVKVLIEESEKTLLAEKERLEAEEKSKQLHSEEKMGEFNKLLSELAEEKDRTAIADKLFDDMTEMSSLIVSLEAMHKELSVLNEDPEENYDAIKELETEFMYALQRVEELSSEELIVYHAPIDEDTGEAQWVPYVFDNKNTFVHYLLGRRLTFQPLVQIFSKMINGLRDEMEEGGLDLDSENYANHIFGLLDIGAFPLLFENVDFSMSSTKYTGLLPDGTPLDSIDREDSVDIIGESLIKMQPNSIADAIENGTVDIRINSLDNLLNISCPFCGVPHEFNDIEDIPEVTQHCTMCNKVLIQYTGN